MMARQTLKKICIRVTPKIQLSKSTARSVVFLCVVFLFGHYWLLRLFAAAAVDATDGANEQACDCSEDVSDLVGNGDIISEVF